MNGETVVNNVMDFPSEHRDHLRILEALLFAASEPLDAESLKARLPKGVNLNKLLGLIKAQYENRGVNLVKTSNKWSFKTAPDLASMMQKEKIVQRKLSKAATETLAIIAYHQPITRSEIENIRGVQMGRGSIDYLTELGWIKPGGRKNIPGKPTLWLTTDMFLEHFGLEDLSHLPNKKELEASGFLDKRSAIATITDIANKDNLESIELDDSEEENLDDFINNS